MNRTGHNAVKFFVGTEVEHTTAFGKKTLFVVGTPTVDEIKDTAIQHATPHIFLGANHSFTLDAEHGYWDETIRVLLNTGFMVSLDYKAELHQHVLSLLSQAVWTSRMFVPMLSVRIPNFETSSPNLTIKIDDIDFKATNAGVWCYPFHEITDSNRFTGWNEYSNDVVIEASEIIETTKPKKTVDNVAEVEMGLDPDGAVVLKPEADEEVSKPVVVPVSKAKPLPKALTAVAGDRAAEVAEAYAAGAKEDEVTKATKKTPTKKAK